MGSVTRSEDKYDKFFLENVRNDVYIHPDQLERVKATMAHDEKDVEKALGAVRESFKKNLSLCI